VSGRAHELARAALGGEAVWVVGGAVRDRLLVRSAPGPEDLDLAVAGDVEAAARALAREGRAAVFALSGEFGSWRVAARDGAWRVDLSPLQGETIEADLGYRDFTVNALAEPLAGGEPIDPTGGLADLAARRLRAVSAEAFDADPLRVLRLARFAAELGFEAEPSTVSAARERASRIAGVSPERIFAELKAIVAGPDPLTGIRMVSALDLTRQVLPELAEARGVTQSHYHHLDVYDHTMAVLGAVLDLERSPQDALGEHAEAVRAVLAEPLGDELTRAQALRFGALLHDAAKPQTRQEFVGGRVGFPGHDSVGADVARGALGRLRAGERLRSHVAALTRHHLRLGFLVHERPLPRRTVYRYLRECDPVEIDVTVLSVADRLATRGRNAEEAIVKHIDLAREMLGEALVWRAAGHRSPLVRGDELARELGIEPGPRLGVLLAELDEARFAGEVTTPAEAVEHAKGLLSGR
jgi:putative nucleotidyltransferase with HDIG domain